MNLKIEVLNTEKNLPQWVGFLSTPAANGRMSKKPVNPHTLFGASSTDPATWGTFNEAAAAVGKTCRVGSDSGTVTGVGFVFAPPYCGIDLDNVICADGSVLPDALDIVESMNSYTEVSPSGKGLHIIYKGKIHPEWKKKQTDAFGENTDLEMYQTGRFFTVTGNVFNGKDTIYERDAVAELVQSTYMKKAPVKAAEKKPVKNLSLSDKDIIDAARNSRNGMLFSELYAGKWEDKYGSQSEADMAFCSMLAFWFGRDEGRMDAVFRQSGLMRDKWDRKQSGTTYGAITLKRAIEGCDQTYSPENAFENNYSLTIKNTGTETKVYTMDDTGNAQRMNDMFGNITKYNYTDRKWLIWNDKKWIYDNGDILRCLIDKSVEQMSKEKKYYEKYDAENGTELLKAFEKHIKKSRSNNSKNAIEREVQHFQPITHNDLDRHRMKLNTPGGVIDLNSLEIVPNDAGLYITKITAYSPSETANCPLWIQFLDDIFGGDRELIRYIQKAVGYSLTGLTDEQCAFFCYGTGRNGKTTFLDVIRCIAGDYASNIQPETIMVRNNTSGISSDIARLKGARFVTSVEPNEGLRLNEGLVKQLTGNDVVTARKLYAEEFEFKPEFKLWMATNHKPVIRGTDLGIWRRIHLIPFTVQIPEDKVDRKLKEKLMQEAEGIFRWCLNGTKMYNLEGLQKPQSVTKATDEYRYEMDVISKFLDECTVDAPCRCVKAKELYTVYSLWCESNNEYKMTNTKFGIEVSKRYEKKRYSNGFGYAGLDFSDDYKPYNISIGEK